MSNDDRLLFCIHSDSLEEAINKDKEVVDAFLEFLGTGECLLLATPSDSSILSSLNPEITRISYEEKGKGSFVAHKQKKGIDQGWTVFHDSLPSSMITELYGCEEDSILFKQMKNAFRDLLAFEAISGFMKNESVFVTQYSNLLEKHVWIQRRFNVKMLSFVQSLEYFDLYLKRRDLYYATPYMRETDGRAFHYWFLLKNLVPRFAEAWSIVVFGKTVIRNGQAFQDVFEGLADRFQNALCASDRIAIEYMKRPINSTEWEMLYNFNYFCLLVTGIFDSLAWLTVHRYLIPIRNRLDVSIQITQTRSRGARFVKAISQHNASLASFINKNQDLIKLFYPMRHSAQHREPVGGAQFEDRDEGWTASLARIRADASKAIQRIDNRGHPFSEWGLLDMIGDYLEPYRFTRTALRKIMDFSNEYLELLDFPSLVTSKALKDKISEARSKEPESSFIAKIYWRRESHLPILFRSR